MAERNATISFPSPSNNARLITWTGLLNGDTGAPLDASEFPVMTIQATGTFGAGGSISLQGSNDGVSWQVIKDAHSDTGGAVTFTAAGLEKALELPRYVRPIVTAGDGTTSLTMSILAHRTGTLN